MIKFLFLLPFIIVFLPFYIVYAIIKAIYKHDQKKTRNENVAALVPQVRKSLRKDRLLLVSVIVDVIRQHWDTLEDKLELYTIEDDYGNVHLSNNIKKEFVYFSEKVVLPALQRKINISETTNKNLALILQDTGLAVAIAADKLDVNDEDSNIVVASKFLSLIDDSSTLADDDELYDAYSSPIALQTYANTVNDAYFNNNILSITLDFKHRFGTNESLTVNTFLCLVMALFFAMHDARKNSNHHVKTTVAKIFEGNDPYKYEEFIKTELRNAGFKAKRTRGSGDYGVDVVAYKNGKSFAIQCKLYNHTVGTKAVQEIVSGRIFYKTDFAIVVSDNSFTDAAKVLARKSDVILTHHRSLLHKLEILAPGDRGTDNRSKLIQL